ncbi:hypothetical protein [Candidatus Nitrososphaera sp. FF02]|uniref:hypothetical protein n=1 Tax=Candidatus Nitrososphaera sp. FF02 TaxID=3398226 RepID=UPI0039E74D39
MSAGPINTPDYEILTYEQLSAEFRNLWPYVNRAHELIPLMYNRLVRIEGYMHKEAVARILKDHKEFRGFSRTNVYRALEDDPSVPHRLVPKRDKNQDTAVPISVTQSSFQVPSPVNGTDQQEPVVQSHYEEAEIDEIRKQRDTLILQLGFADGYYHAKLERYVKERQELAEEYLRLVPGDNKFVEDMEKKYPIPSHKCIKERFPELSIDGCHRNEAQDSEICVP